MARQTTLSDVATQRTLTESAKPATDDTSETPTDLLDRAQQHATNVAAEHFPELPIRAIEWEVSHRAQRQAGVTKYDPTTEAITIALTWTAYEHHGRVQFSSTVRHELIHAWQYHEFGDADHDATFTRWIDALDTSRHCERFKSANWYNAIRARSVLRPRRSGGEWCPDQVFEHELGERVEIPIEPLVDELVSDETEE
ncbi:SprT-like domain-containing protein [Haladaptatus sp. DFWS20]|uniref:SprT-like domain-containing protein n=1 Tax=Haladaptatus sp. DFWS20 TaxID=3403467 RepID=UPI003EBE6730